MVRVLPVLLSLFVGLVAAGCGGGDGEDDVLNVSGTWDVRVVTRVYNVSGVRHEDTLTGTINLSDSDGLLSGTSSIPSLIGPVSGVFSARSAARTITWRVRTSNGTRTTTYNFSGLVSSDGERMNSTSGDFVSWSATRR
jgi:hypothetical protein